VSDNVDRTPIFEAVNQHSRECGDPPRISTGAANKYYGYFQNGQGEQFIFEYDYEKKMAKMWCGDCGWENATPITDPQRPPIIMDKAEWLWLQACWMAAIALNK
jgi:hypothetical protein